MMIASQIYWIIYKAFTEEVDEAEAEEVEEVTEEVSGAVATTNPQRYLSDSGDGTPSPDIDIIALFWVILSSHCLCLVSQIAGKMMYKSTSSLGLLVYWMQNIIGCYFYFSIILYYLYYSKLFEGWSQLI